MQKKIIRGFFVNIEMPIQIKRCSTAQQIDAPKSGNFLKKGKRFIMMKDLRETGNDSSYKEMKFRRDTFQIVVLSVMGDNTI